MKSVSYVPLMARTIRIGVPSFRGHFLSTQKTQVSSWGHLGNSFARFSTSTRSSQKQLKSNPKLSRPLQIINAAKEKVQPNVQQIITAAKDKVPPNVQQLFQDNIYTVPNFLTLTRILTTPVIGYCIVKGHNDLGGAIFVYSCITDFVDGYIARNFKNQKSVMGSILDPMADKFLMAVCTLTLAYTSAIPGYLAVLIIGRDMMLSFMGFFYRWKSLPQGTRNWKNWADISKSTISVHPNMLSKINTGLQMVYIGGLVLMSGLERVVDPSLLATFYSYFEVVVAITTVSSGISYLNKKHFKVITPGGLTK